VIDLSKLSKKVLCLLLFEGIINNVVADYLWARAVILTSATVATVGLSVTIPMSICTDSFLGKTFLTPLKLVGIALVFVGFFFVNFDKTSTKENDEISVNPDYDEELMISTTGVLYVDEYYFVDDIVSKQKNPYTQASRRYFPQPTTGGRRVAGKYENSSSNSGTFSDTCLVGDRESQNLSMGISSCCQSDTEDEESVCEIFQLTNPSAYTHLDDAMSSSSSSSDDESN